MGDLGIRVVNGTRGRPWTIHAEGETENGRQGVILVSPRGDGQAVLLVPVRTPLVTAEDLRRLAATIEALNDGTYQPTPTFDEIVAAAGSRKGRKG